MLSYPILDNLMIVYSSFPGSQTITISLSWGNNVPTQWANGI